MAKVGRPLKFKSVQELERLIEKYFKECDKKEKPLTITGLAIALNTTRETLLDYEAKDEFSFTIKKAKTMCENYVEERLFGNTQVAGAIFNLKNNYKRWKDKSETEMTHIIPKPLLDNVRNNQRLKEDTQAQIED